MHESVIMSGFRRPGVLLMGQLLCYAGMHEGKKVTWMPSYGPEMRGGTANCTVMISSDRVGSPVTRLPRSWWPEQSLSGQFEDAIPPGGFSGGQFLPGRSGPCSGRTFAVIKVPANQIAEEAGTLQVTNMAALGAYVAGRKVVSLDSVVLALKRMIPAHRKEMLGGQRGGSAPGR